jgi:hypothetical protein
MKDFKVPLSGFKPTAVRSKWFEVDDLNHTATDVPSTEVQKPKNIRFEFLLTLEHLKH